MYASRRPELHPFYSGDFQLFNRREVYFKLVNILVAFYRPAGSKPITLIYGLLYRNNNITITFYDVMSHLNTFETICSSAEGAKKWLNPCPTLKTNVVEPAWITFTV